LFRHRVDHLRKLVQRDAAEQEIVCGAFAVVEEERSLLGVDGDEPVFKEEVVLNRWDVSGKHRARSAEKREPERAVRAPANIVALEDDIGQDALEIDDADPLGYPVLRHLTKREGPDLLVVREHKMPCYPLAEDRLYPLLEVTGRAMVERCFKQADQAVEHNLFGQVPDVVLERVWDPPAEHSDEALALVRQEILTQHAINVSVEVFVVGEHNVAAYIPDKPLFIHKRRGQAADVVLLLVNLPVSVTKLVEPVCCADARRAGANYDYLSLHRTQTSRIPLTSEGLRMLHRPSLTRTDKYDASG